MALVWLLVKKIKLSRSKQKIENPLKWLQI